LTAGLPLKPKPQSDIRFIADVHLGRLAKYLRLCGFDTLYDASLNDRQIIESSLADHRIILSRDKELLKNKKVTDSHRILSQKPVDQLTEVMKRFDLKDSLHPFTRCLECNGTFDDVPKEEILSNLLPRTKDYYADFKKCSGCGKIYWEGSHFERMKKFILTISYF
jgi:uncharacterized protein with PIN domain